MSHFEDLSDYTYHNSAAYRAGTKNIGWLARGHAFERARPTEDVLQKVWDYCTVSVAQMRGVHDCDFCPPGEWYVAERNGQKLLLGTSEIRVFAHDGTIYAAPTLLYHYMLVHHYKPPDEFLRALSAGPRPPNPEYIQRLERLGLEWNMTATIAKGTKRFRFNLNR